MSETTLNHLASKSVLTRLVTSVFFRTARVADHVQLAPSVHHITLEGEALRGVDWTAGDKIQIRLGSGLQTRTYTPVDWDPGVGRTSFVAQTLSPGPGSRWVEQASKGDIVEVMGPRASLALGTTAPQDVVVLGDETALGLALGWGAGHTVLEVGSPDSLKPLCYAWNLSATLLARQADGSHLKRMEDAMWENLSPQTQFVLAGRAGTIQHLLKALRARGIASGRIRSKAYWANGKVGLD